MVLPQALLGLALAGGSALMWHAQPTPYMDELFHVPQAQKYCAHNFSHWDPMITTLPGLYLHSTLLHEPFRQLGVDSCTTFFLRMTNILLTFGLLVALTRAFSCLRPAEPARLLEPLSVLLLPILFFFSFLYYTDVASTLWVVVCLSLALGDRPYASAAAGAVAILCRQTNVVWVAFAACVGLIRHVQQQQQSHGGGSSNTTLLACHSLLQSILAAGRHAIAHPIAIMARALPFLAVGAAFLAFVFYNGGIVVGDRSAHEPVLHLAMPFYCSAFACGFFAPSLLAVGAVRDALRLPCMKSPFQLLQALAGLAVVCACVVLGTYAHPYLLADNRHYTFYLWKNVLSKPNIRYLACACYFMCVRVIWSAISHHNILVRLAFFACTCATLVPAKLLEPRYFVVPLVLFRLLIRRPPTWAVVAETLIFGVVNAATLYVFAARPFSWPETGQPQRFMW